EIFGLASDPKVRKGLDDIREAIELMEANIGRAHKLVQDFKKLSVGQISDTKESLDLVELNEEIGGLFRINAREGKLKIEVRNELAEPAARAWMGYRGYLTQVLLNLLTNIERYAYPDGEGGRLEIELTVEEARMEALFVLTVRDFGRGIAPDDLPKVFV